MVNSPEAPPRVDPRREALNERLAEIARRAQADHAAKRQEIKRNRERRRQDYVQRHKEQGQS